MIVEEIGPRAVEGVVSSKSVGRVAGVADEDTGRNVITFNEGPGRGKIWPGSKNFSNFNPSFAAEERKKRERRLSSRNKLLLLG